MNQLKQRLVAAEQVEGDEGRGLTAGQVVPVNWRPGRPGDQSPGASSATLDGMFDFRHPITARSSRTRRAGSQHTADACAPDTGHPVGLAADDLSGRAHEVPVAAVVVLPWPAACPWSASPR